MWVHSCSCAPGFLPSRKRKRRLSLTVAYASGSETDGVASIARFRQWLGEAEFRDIAFRDITEHVIPSSRRIYIASVLFYPLGLLLHWIGLRTAMQTRGIASGYYQYQARRRGLGVYGIFRAVK
jgi:hypothetical protein